MELYEFLQKNNFEGILIPSIDILIKDNKSIKEINAFYKNSVSDIELDLKCALLADFLYAKYNKTDEASDSYWSTSARIAIDSIIKYMSHYNKATFEELDNVLDYIIDKIRFGSTIPEIELKYFNQVDSRNMATILIQISLIFDNLKLDCKQK